LDNHQKHKIPPNLMDPQKKKESKYSANMDTVRDA
jgi:hypothetical protein